MRIGIDARTILNPEKGEAIGSGHYTYQLIRHLLDIDKENEYVLFFDFRVREKDVKKFTRPNVKIKFYPFSDYKKYLPGVYSELLGTATLQKEKLDLLHSTSPYSRIPVGYRGKTVVTFHNMAIFKIPANFPKIRRTRDRASFSLMAKKADKIIAVSNSIKNEMKSIFGCADDQVKVIYSGLDKRFFDELADNHKKVLDKYNIKKNYILFLGTLEPSKNITRLLESFAMFKNKCQEGGNKFDYQLVLAGKRGWLSQQYQQIIKDLGLAKDVVFTGYIIGEELGPLFKNSQFFILPSLYEGFGTTLLEAFATGTPSIASNVGSLPEIADEAAYFINPLDTDGMAEAMGKFAADENLRNSYRDKGLEQAKKFDWEKCARETLAVYNSLK